MQFGDLVQPRVGADIRPATKSHYITGLYFHLVNLINQSIIFQLDNYFDFLIAN